jgi:hypothetical protein
MSLTSREQTLLQQKQKSLDIKDTKHVLLTGGPQVCSWITDISAVYDKFTYQILSISYLLTYLLSYLLTDSFIILRQHDTSDNFLYSHCPTSSSRKVCRIFCKIQAPTGPQEGIKKKQKKIAAFARQNLVEWLLDGDNNEGGKGSILSCVDKESERIRNVTMLHVL